MKIDKGLTLMSIAGSNVVVPIGEKNISFRGMITLNNTGAFLWRHLEKDITKSELLKAMLEEYEVSQATAETDIDKFIETLKSAQVLE